MVQNACEAIVADAHSLCRSGMATMLGDFGYSQISTAGDFNHLKRVLSTRPLAKLASISMDLPGLDGSLGLRRLRMEWPDLRIIVLSDVAERDQVLEAISAGIHGFIPKTYTDADMRSAIGAVVEGHIYVPNIVCDLRSSPVAAVRPNVEGPAGEVELTGRQHEVLKLLASGQSNKEIARSLGISEGTVKVHVNASFRALGVHNRVRAAAAMAGLRTEKVNNEPFLPGLVFGRNNNEREASNGNVRPISMPGVA